MQPPKPKPKRVVGIDFGLSRLGIALSDERQIFASPFLTLHAEKKTEATILKLLGIIEEIQTNQKCEIEEVVIGLPLMMSGKTGFLADEVQNFIKEFKLKSPLPIHPWDERLTTVQAERSLRESSMTRKKRTKVVDIVSAAIILQSYLDRKFLISNQTYL
jgi:putative holliday junction resolvase